MNYKLWFWIVNIVSTALRFLVTSKIDITTDEAYRHLDLFYFDHSPITAYLTKASILIFGNNEFAARFLTALIFFFIYWIFFICAKKLYNERTAFTGVLSLNVLPAFSFFGFAIALPNSLFVLFWISALLVFIILIETNNKNYWYLLGIIIGFTMLSGYNATLIFFSIFMSLILLPSHRSWFKKKEPYLALIISALIFSPAIIWNIENNSLSQSAGILLPKFSLTLLGTSLGVQACYISPLLFLIFIIATLLCIKEVYQKKDRAAIIIACFSSPAFLPLKGIAVFNEILPHWTATGYLVLSIYTAHLTLKFWHIKWFRAYSYAAWGFALFTLITSSLHIHPIEKFLHINHQRHVVSKPEKTYIKNEFNNWENTVRIINLKEKPFTFIYKSYLASKFVSSDNIDAYGIRQKHLNSHTADVLEPEKDLRQKLIEFDHSAFKFINSNLKSKFLDFYVSLISYCDSKSFNLSFFMILIISIGILWNNKKERFWTALIFLASILAIVAIIMFFLKHYFKRPRPLKVLGDKNVNTFFEKLYCNAFPSGHTQIVFSTCTFMFIVVKKYWYWYLILALGVSFERIYAGYHFPFDVLAGAVIGIISTYATVALFKKYFKI
ncbi:MAG: glycosyltransferase family 39 protein [Endomicrobium sp.]|jgi:membrane-associated phospholipid phosphatase|nr:glycosyltransferase family 39 protein [Endomicrobium sp.]